MNVMNTNNTCKRRWSLNWREELEMEERRIVHETSSIHGISSVHEISRKKELAKKILKNATIFDQQDGGLDGRTAQEDISKNKKGKNKSKVRIKPISTDDKVNPDFEESTLNEPQEELEELIQGEVHEKRKQRQPNGQMFIEYQVGQRVHAQLEEEILKRKQQKEKEEKTKRLKAEKEEQRKRYEEEQRKRYEKRIELKKELKDKEAKVKELKSEKETLKQNYKKKLPDYTDALKKLRTFSEAEDTYHLIIEQLVNDVVEKELTTLLTAPVVEREGCNAIVTSGDRDQYGAYGLLLSAYKVLHPSLPDDKTEDDGDKSKADELSEDTITKACTKVAVQLEGEMKEKAATNVKTSIKLTREMLFLIPPLVVGSKERVRSYHEDLCDTNRKTWDENKKGDQLLWYRPVITYGNQLHIAVKGLVGNCTEPIPEEEKEEEVQTDADTNEGVSVSPEITMHADPEETSDTNDESQGDKDTNDESQDYNKETVI